ncbi:CDP-alcohol phosphatidyltransferase family protein [Prosthecodimorpha staleyi]|uniref:CDP-diacylglycerol--glycerol-3-phosphate 3-phosphatidyltransferase n=1 Tax=Prosthecodimorpha staleyi TaxID=2840188 RepID=A0A947DB39_9HYPH|nr:CDP-alcohol phosphatidyltransferase family protein [Prosthecodimorpha staleyi]MBT9292252.1 CDP-alcohol phosphatidyltransferase family protein [Prosthecodimorpha staleyi]
MVYSNVTLPNLITVARLIAVPMVVVAITEQRLDLAFWLFVLAGASDGVDGWIARRWNLRTRLGAYLDAIADKSLLVAIYVTLGIEGVLPRWLVILVVSRDLLIVGAFLLSWVMGRPVEVRPLMISKINTTAQILLAATILGDHAFAVDLLPLVAVGLWIVAGLTVGSGAAYLVGWLRAMSADSEAGSGAGTSWPDPR